MKKYFLLLSIFIPFFLYSTGITENKLVQYGEKAFSMKLQGVGFTKQTPDFRVKTVDYVINDGDTLFAVINFAPTGFILISNSNATKPVMGYSLENNIDFQNMAPAQKEIIEGYKEEFAEINTYKLKGSATAHSDWKKLSLFQEKLEESDSTIVVEDSVIVEKLSVKPLTKTMWSQNKYYNTLCPPLSENSSIYDIYDGRTPNGCVALTMAMIMYYYRYPYSGEGEHTNVYSKEYANFEKAYYDYESMQDKLTSYNNEVAKLIFDCGTSVNMLYGDPGSGASIAAAEKALKKYFKYSSNTKLISKKNYSEEEWKSLLLNELIQKHPVYYRGRGATTAGHVFICDGFDEDTLFHFNFGWGGVGNGYFDINSLNPNSVGGYYVDQQMIINLYPRDNYPYPCEEKKIINSTSGVLASGNLSDHYLNNNNCSYIIAPPNATNFKITLQELQTEKDHDILSFWINDSTLVHSFSGSITDSSFTIEADTLRIVFQTNDSITDTGWRLAYDVIRDVDICKSITREEGNFGVLEVGNGVDEYASEASCFWAIRPYANGVKQFVFYFHEFDVADDDYLVFTDYNNRNEKTIRFNANNPPPDSLIWNTGQLKVNFNTDNKNQGKGFKISWKNNLYNPTGIDNPDITNDYIRLYPNPATDKITLEIPHTVAENWEMVIYDLTGKSVMSTSLISEKQEVSIKGFTPGFYCAVLRNGQNVYTKKFVVN